MDTDSHTIDRTYATAAQGAPAGPAELSVNAFQAALEHHRAGRLEAAATAYLAVVGSDPDQPEAWHGLAQVFHAAGQLEAADQALSRALSLRPDVSDWHAERGLLLRAAGRHADAAASYRRALELGPGAAETWHNLGNALLLAGDRAGAVEAWSRAAALRPGYALPQMALARAWRDAGDTEAAAEAYARATTLRPDDADLAQEHGRVLLALERTEEAREAFARAVALDPALALAHSGLACCLKEEKRAADAEQAFRRALALDPTLAVIGTEAGPMLGIPGLRDEIAAACRRGMEARPDDAVPPYNLANALRSLDRPDEAIGFYRRALALKPDFAMAHNNLGGALKESALRRHPQDLETLDEAERALLTGLSLTPEDAPEQADFRFGLSLLQLHLGRYPDGWRNYVWRWRKKDMPGRLFDQPEWGGEPLDGRTILLHWEQGFGDTIQFIRFAERVKARGGRVVVLCQGELKSLLARTPGIDALVTIDDVIPAFDVQAPMLGVPAALGLDVADLPGRIPYVFAPPAAAERWRAELGGYPGLKVGLVWQGNPGHSNDEHRSLPLAAFAPLADVQGVTLFSLQKGGAARQMDALADRLPIVDLGPRLHSFAQTAAALMALDLVIACDTSVVHLAGALGRPVWCLVSHFNDWRWMIERDDSPWYPTLRLFRRRWGEDWTAVTGRVAEATRHM